MSSSPALLRSFAGPIGATVLLAALAMATVPASQEGLALPPPAVDIPAGQASSAVAVLAGGCFWGVQGVFQHVKGVTNAVSGYAGGERSTATYEQTNSGTTGHAESVQITYDPARITYERLLEIFWREIDPTDDGGQFVDRGPQYRTVVFVHDDAQRAAAEASKAALAAGGRFERPIVTRILPFTTFYPAEDYHQDFYLKNPAKYKFYRWNCGRDQRLEQIWGKATH